MEARFIKFAGDKIVIKRSDGLSFTVMPDLFSGADRKYLEELRKTFIIKDKFLEAALRKPDKDWRIYGRNKPKFMPTSPLTSANLSLLEYLEAKDAEITNISGLEYATNLTEVVLTDNLISDLAPLAGLSKLVSLELQGNEIIDLAPLAGLSNLSILKINSNQIACFENINAGQAAHFFCLITNFFKQINFNIG